MELRWNLDALYTSFESAEFQSDFQKCQEMVGDFNRWVQTNLTDTDSAAARLEEAITRINALTNLFSLLMGYSSLNISINAKNEKALQMQEKIQRLRSELVVGGVQFEKWVATIPNLDELIETSEFLAEYRFMLTEILQKSKYVLSEQEETIIAKMNNTGAEAWSSLHNVLTSSMMVNVPVDGEIKRLPLALVRNMASEKEQAVRKAAFEAELAVYPAIEVSSAAALNGIKGQSITVAKLRGFQSPLEQTLVEARMNKETLTAMLQAMKESLPVFHKYFRRKAELLGHENGLPFYDMVAPMGSADLSFTYEEARDYIVENFRKFSDKLADFAAHAFDNQWIDAEPREGKQGGAFCSNLLTIKQSRILTNFNGTFASVSTLAHELGHAYHGECLSSEARLNSRYPMPLAETASIFTETIVFNAAIQQAKEEEAFTILEKSIANAGQIIVDIYSRYLFESEVFKRRADHVLSANELKEIMLTAQKEAYGDGLDHNQLHPYMWIPKSHYYYSFLNYYNFPYAFGLLFAKGIYAEYLRRGQAFVPEFDRLLAATGKNSIADVAKMVDIDVTSLDFWRSSLAIIAEDIERFLALSE